MGIILLSISDPQTFPQCNHILLINLFILVEELLLLVFQPINSGQNIFILYLSRVKRSFQFDFYVVSTNQKLLTLLHTNNFYFC